MRPDGVSSGFFIFASCLKVEREYSLLWLTLSKMNALCLISFIISIDHSRNTLCLPLLERRKFASLPLLTTKFKLFPTSKNSSLLQSGLSANRQWSKNESKK